MVSRGEAACLSTPTCPNSPRSIPTPIIRTTSAACSAFGRRPRRRPSHLFRPARSAAPRPGIRRHRRGRWRNRHGPQGPGLVSRVFSTPTFARCPVSSLWVTCATAPPALRVGRHRSPTLPLSGRSSSPLPIMAPLSTPTSCAVSSSSSAFPSTQIPTPRSQSSSSATSRRRRITCARVSARRWSSFAAATPWRLSTRRHCTPSAIRTVFVRWCSAV